MNITNAQNVTHLEASQGNNESLQGRLLPVEYLKAGTTQRYYRARGAEALVVLKGEITINGETAAQGSVVTNRAGAIIDLVARNDAFIWRSVLSSNSSDIRPADVRSRSPNVEGPLVSVIVTAFNVAAYIPVALQSLLEQTYDNLEIVVYDDCSTDETVHVVQEIAATDPRIKLVQGEKNVGGALAKKHGLLAASGEYFVFCDGDDFVEPGMIAEGIKASIRTGADCVVFGFDHFNEATGDYFGEQLPSSSAKWDYGATLGKRSADDAFRLTTLSHISSIYLLRSAEHKAPFAGALLDMPYFYDVPTFLATITSCKKLATVDRIFYHYRIGRAGQSVEGWALTKRGEKTAAIVTSFDYAVSDPWSKGAFSQALVFTKAVRLAIAESVQVVHHGRPDEAMASIIAFQAMLRRFPLRAFLMFPKRPRFSVMALAFRLAPAAVVRRLIRRM